MPDGFVEAIIFIALFVAFWVLQLRTRFFSTRYFLQVGSLFVIALLSLYLLAQLLAAPITLPGLGAALLLALVVRSEEHTSELQSHLNLVCRLLLEKKKKT